MSRRERLHPSTRVAPGMESGTEPYACFCGGAFATREALIQHNVQEHDWSQDASRRAVEEKYPE
jgi:hypothetical protein